MYYVYILHSNSSGKYYVGQSNDIENRMYRHNHGYVRSTKAYVPWELACVIEKETRSEAIILEMK